MKQPRLKRSQPNTPKAKPYKPRHPWPTGYRTRIYNLPPMMFEVFLVSPKTFIRGEGGMVGSQQELIERAEDEAWRKYQVILNCPYGNSPAGHEFIKKGQTDGSGFCLSCNLWKMDAFMPARKPCEVCGVKTHFFHDTDGGAWCMNHWLEIPAEKRSQIWYTYLENSNALEGYVKHYRKQLEEHGKPGMTIQ